MKRILSSLFLLSVAAGSVAISPAKVQVTTSTLPAGTVGVPYSAQLAATGGVSPYTWSMFQGQLPAGLKLSGSGAISGTPQTAGTSTFKVQVVDTKGQKANASLSITVTAVSITTTSLPNGIVGTAYSVTIYATGGTAPYTFSLSSGVLPAGLSLASGGTLSGTPAAPGPSTFTIKATDTNGATAAQTYTLTIVPITVPADPTRVLVLYSTTSADNDHDGVGDSQELANYYALKRGVPQTNLLGLTITAPNPCVTAVCIDYASFQSQIVGPVKQKLAQLGSTNIDTILLAGNLPTIVFNSSNTAVSLDNVLMGLNYWSSGTDNISQQGNPYFAPTPGFSADTGRFNHTLYKFNSTDMYLVARLGSDDPLRGLDQVDQALYADLYVSPLAGYYNGNAYVDSRYGQPSGAKYTDAFLASQAAVQYGMYDTYADADLNIAYSEHFVTQAGFPLKWENTTTSLVIGAAGATFSDGTSALTAPRALFYGGWYNYNQYLDVWEWLPGSVACDLNSSSYFGMQALKHGASAAAYVVNEPYLDGHQRPPILYYYILKGYTFAEASTLSTPYIGWMGLNEGDPLYAPMRPKTPVQDVQAPVFSLGYPAIAVDSTTGNSVVHVLVDDSAGPEVVKARVDYGLTTAYGSTAYSAEGYSRRPSIILPLAAGQTYHYQVTLTDPVGNTTVSADYTFSR